ncbi:zinc finger protein [Saccharopolyspora taberi]|uniref:Zinc-finger n=1 Tax=Saccharopolyspora taberi TaxID=60895 RepID=A0ABN3VE90_9PSEU
MGMPQTSYRPHPFRWVPAEGQRHATTDRLAAGGWSDGEAVTMLCGESVEVDNSVEAWLWETCADCNAEAHRMARVPMVAAP